MPGEYLIDPILRRANELSGVLEPHRSLATVRDSNERLAATVSLHGDRRWGLPAASTSRAARPSR
jgi:hypothetical protein